MLRELFKPVLTIGAPIWEEKILPVFRESLFQEKVFSSPLIRVAFKYWEYLFKLSDRPLVRNNSPVFDSNRNNFSWIPINKDIEGLNEVALSEEILDRFIETAKHRVIVNFCGCRKAERCTHYPADLGCLMMGESALLIPEKSKREVGIEEAKDHVRKAIKAGLTPITGKIRADNDIFMLPDKGKLLTVCFCCECCCVTRLTRHISPDLLNEMHLPIEGLSISVTDDCVGCGECIDSCYINALEMEDSKVSIGEMCRVCGRCALKCPNNAIRLKIDDSHKTAQQVFDRISSTIDY